MTQQASSRTELVAGLDLGTQGVRIIIANATGEIVAQASHTFPHNNSSPADLEDPNRFEQDPRIWWAATVDCLRQASQQLAPEQSALQALAITSTSGTICLLDADGEPLHPAIMYSDQRATDQSHLLNETLSNQTITHGYRFNASFGLPKICWMRHHHPAIFAATRFIAHANDFLAGKLTGEYGISDWSHALKTGYDLIEQTWPPALWQELNLPAESFPHIVAPGVTIGHVTPQAAEQTGLPAGLPVVAGMTDGCTGQIAGGAVAAGQWLSVLGTTLVFKGVTHDLLYDPQGRIYSHRHPAGMWLPGSASNTGGEVLVRRFPDANLAAMDQKAARLTPSGILCYPLERSGERFPFLNSSARGFLVGETDTEGYYTACLEGVGYIERLAYETLIQLGATVNEAIYVTGGGTRSPVWLQIRANILNRPLLVPQHPEAAFGAAVLAGGATLYPDLVTATHAMVQTRQQIEPQAVAQRYAELYAQFLEECQEHGYLNERKER
jgi:xylulokinase